jgi:signal transduction histidine kinase
MKNRAEYIGRVVLLAAVYVAVARLGLKMDAVSGFATLVWAPTGISLAALLISGQHLWPGIALGAVVVNVWTGAPLPVACGIALGNTLEAVAGAYALRRIPGFQLSLCRVGDALALVLAAAGLSTLLSATLGVSSLVLSGVVPAARFGVTWRAWWLGDVAGDLLVAPLLLTWSRSSFDGDGWRRRVEAVALYTSLIATSVFIFVLHGDSGGVEEAVRQPHFLLPHLIWAALRFGPRGAARATFLVSAVAIAGLAFGLGPFVRASLHESLAGLQAYMAMIAVTFLIVGAAAAERRHRGLENARLYQEAHKALGLRDELLAIVSHDLQNPLGVILMSESVLLQSPATDDKGRQLHKHAQTVHRAAERMRRLIDDLVDFASIQAGQLAVELRPHDPVLLGKEAVDGFRALAREGKQNLQWATQADLPKIDCDRDRALQVLSNLIANALRVTPPGGSISVSVEQRAREVVFSVADTGPGIGIDELPHLFQRYFRGKGAEYKGTGLGLAIAKGIVDAHGGRIWVESELGAGSTFFLTLSGPRAPTPRRRRARAPELGGVALTGSKTESEGTQG